MKITVLLFVLLSAACSAPRLVRICSIPQEAEYFGTPAGYIDRQGDTVIPIGKYLHCYTDTIRRMGIVVQQAHERRNAHDVMIAIDARGRRLFNVFRFDNGPDWVCDGLFRITDDQGLIGYADTTGRVVVQPQFQAAYQFNNGRAYVALKATETQDGEYTVWWPEDGFEIDTRGRRVAGE